MLMSPITLKFLIITSSVTSGCISHPQFTEHMLENNLGGANRPNHFSCINNGVVLVLDPWICQPICLQSSDCLTVKAVKASINVPNVSYKSCTLLWYAKKEN